MQNCPLLQADYKDTEEYPVSKLFLLVPLYCQYLGNDWSKFLVLPSQINSTSSPVFITVKGKLVTKLLSSVFGTGFSTRDTSTLRHLFWHFLQCLALRFKYLPKIFVFPHKSFLMTCTLSYSFLYSRIQYLSFVCVLIKKQNYS